MTPTELGDAIGGVVIVVLLLWVLLDAWRNRWNRKL